MQKEYRFSGTFDQNFAVLLQQENNNGRNKGKNIERVPRIERYNCDDTEEYHKYRQEREVPAD